MKTWSYCQALNQAIIQEMERDPRVFVYGIGVPDHKKIFGSTDGILERFGSDRCIDTPIAEDSMTGFGLGAAINGLRPIHIHIRVDFLLLAMNQLANMVSSFCYGSAGKVRVPLVIRAVVGRGWGQGYQHSKTMHSTFAHIPGLKVVTPTTVADAKGLMVSAIRDDNPVLVIEHRWLYWQEGAVPDGDYTVRIGEPNVIHTGDDLTIIATSWMNVEALMAAEILQRRGVSIEIVDPRTLAPLEDEKLVASVEKTGHCIVADNDWAFCGFGAEIAARISEKCFGRLKSPVERIGFAHVPCPTARHLETEFYPNAAGIIRMVERKLGLSPTDISGENFFSHENRFRGPF
jgi:acetoin:2,6-dichlorophenolindophenol oxidoreductase subunit beta